MKKVDLSPLVYSLLMALMMVLGSSNMFGQPTPVFVECTAGDYPDEIGWEILTCDSSLILEGGAPYFGAAQMTDSYIIHMTDTYGDGWNGAYLTIDTTSYGFLSDVDWIDSLGTWPQEYTEQWVTVNCGENSIHDIHDIPFTPTIFYNFLGQRTRIARTGYYIGSDGVRTRLIYIDETE